MPNFNPEITRQKLAQHRQIANLEHRLNALEDLRDETKADLNRDGKAPAGDRLFRAILNEIGATKRALNPAPAIAPMGFFPPLLASDESDDEMDMDAEQLPRFTS